MDIVVFERGFYFYFGVLYFMWGGGEQEGSEPYIGRSNHLLRGSALCNVLKVQLRGLEDGGD